MAVQSNQKYKKTTPTLRFPEFSGEWEEKKFSDISEINQGLQIPIAQRYLENIPGSHFYITNEFLRKDSKKKYYIKNPPNSVLCYEDDLLMTRTGNTGKVVTNIRGAFHNNFFKIKYDKQKVEKLFLYYFLNLIKTQRLILRLAGSSTIPDLNHSDFYRIRINLPVLQEQQKIASFLTSIDDWIENLKKQKEAQEKYKKGMMQKLFSQELRFKIENENGELVEPPEWEEKRLGELLEYEQPTKYLVSDTEYNNDNKTPVITAGKTFILGYTHESDGIFEDELPVIIFDDFTTASQFVNFPFKAKSSAMKILKPKGRNKIKFLFEALRNVKFEVGGHGRHWISVFSSMNILIPTVAEQEKIADFLSSIDDLINLSNQRITQAEKWKKGLMQKMFA